MKSKPPFRPPNPLDGLDISQLEIPEPRDPKSQKDSLVYKKYLYKYDQKSPENLKKAKEEKARKRKQWWAANWIAFCSLIVASIALVVSIIALLK